MKTTYPKTGFGKTAHGTTAPGTISKTKRRLVVTGLLLLLLGAWCLWPNSRVAMVRQMQQELFSTPRE